MQTNHATRIIEALGEDRLRTYLGWTERNIRHAKSTGLFSGLWYDALRNLCEKHNVFCPVEAFKWKLPANNVGIGATVSESAAIPTANAP